MNPVIEIDGSQHLEDLHRPRDLKRDCELGASGPTVLRCNSLEVLKDTNGGLKSILRAIAERLE